MQLLHGRLICRAHNRFPLSPALSQPLFVFRKSIGDQKRLVTSATDAVAHTLELDVRPSDNSATNGSVEADVVDSTKAAPESPQWTIHRKKTAKGKWLDRENPKIATQRLLKKTKAAYEAGEDYEAVIVKPLVRPLPNKNTTLPWIYKDEEKPLSGHDRYHDPSALLEFGTNTSSQGWPSRSTDSTNSRGPIHTNKSLGNMSLNKYATMFAKFSQIMIW